MYKQDINFNQSNPNNQEWSRGYGYDAKTEKIRKDVLKEIKKENLKIKLFSFLVSIPLLFFTILTTLWGLDKGNIINVNLEKTFFLFQPWIFVSLNIIFLMISIFVFLNHYRFAQEKQYHFAHKDEIDINRVPNFIIDKYKRIIGLGIVFTWLFAVSFLVCAAVLIFFLLLQDKEYIEIIGLRIQKQGGEKFPDYQKEIIIISCYLSFVFLTFLLINIYVSKEKSRLIALFDLKNKFNNWEEIHRYQKIVHIICFCVFVIPLVIIILLFKFGKKLLGK